MLPNQRQSAVVILDTATIDIELPGPECLVVPGVKWGLVEAFPSPAYWAYQAIARRVVGRRIRYRLGSTLREEIGACLLGGHGIPAKVGLAAFGRLRDQGAFSGVAHAEETLVSWLSLPMTVDGKAVRYRFARQKAKYLAAALAMLETATPPMESGQALRNWLLSIPGVGYKTASWIARNWLDADDIAILDIHILRAGLLAGFFPKHLAVDRHYLELEALFLAFSEGIGVPASELDAVIWYEMMSSRGTVHQLFESISN